MLDSLANSPWSHPLPREQGRDVPFPGDFMGAGAPQAPPTSEGIMPLMESSETASSIAGPDELMSDAPPQTSSATTLVDGTVFHPLFEDTLTGHLPEDLRVASSQRIPTPGPQDHPSAERLLPNCHAVELAGIGEHVCISSSAHDAFQLPGSPMSEDHGSPAPDDDHLPSAPSPAPTTISLIVHPRTPPRYQIEGLETHAPGPTAEESGSEMEIEVERRAGRRDLKRYRREATKKYLQKKSRRPRRPGDTKTVFDCNPYSTSSATTSHPWSPYGSGDGNEGLGGTN